MATVHHLSKVPLWIHVRSDRPVGGEQDIDGFPVEVAFPIVGEVPETFYEAEWHESGTTVARGRKNYYVAIVYVGPGSDVGELEAGQAYQPYVRVTTPTDTPVIPAELLIVS